MVSPDRCLLGSVGEPLVGYPRSCTYRGTGPPEEATSGNHRTVYDTHFYARDFMLKAAAESYGPLASVSASVDRPSVAYGSERDRSIGLIDCVYYSEISDSQGSVSFKLSSQILAEVWCTLEQLDYLQDASNTRFLQLPQISQEASRGYKAIACLLCGVCS